MDISETESDDYDLEATDDEWKESGKLVRKRKSLTRRPSMEHNQSKTNNSKDLKDNLGDGFASAYGETASDICCSCSKISSCKTTKCKCKSRGNSCGSSCGCLATKCANRASLSNESQESMQSGLVQRTGNNPGIEEADKDRLLATQGAELLQGALSDRPAETNSDQAPRKPLSDIGNTQIKPNLEQRKKLRKSTIILVSDPPPSSQPEISNVRIPKKQNITKIYETNIAANSCRPQRKPPSRPENAACAPRAEANFVDPDSPVKRPSAARRAGSSNTGVPLWDRNAGKSDESVSKEPENIEARTRTPQRQKRTQEEKENSRR